MRILLAGDPVPAREPSRGHAGTPRAGGSALPVPPTAGLAVANLEAPLVDPDRPADQPMTIRVPTRTARQLRDLCLDVVSLATDHALDHGVDGLLGTLHALDDAGVRHTGGGRTPAEADAGVVLDTDDGSTAEGPPRLRIVPIVLDGHGEPLVAGPACVRAVVEISSGDIDPSVRVAEDGTVTFGEEARQ